MSDVNTFAPQTPSPWGHLNEATNPEALEDPNEQPAQVNHQSFTDWNVENASGDELQDLKGYADYVRQEYVDKDQATVGFEQDLRQLVYNSAFQKGLLNEEDGDEVNNQKLFGTPEFSVESSIKLISESSSASVAAIAANNLSALPEGTDPNQVWDDIITYKAKQKAFANSMAIDPETTSKNQEIKDDLAFWKERAEGYANSGIYDRAAKDALLDGRVAATRIFKDDGSSYVQVGKGAEGMSVKDIIASSKDYGVTLQDAASISKQLETPEGFRHTTADIMRKQEIGAIFDGILEADNVAPAPVESGSRVANTAADAARMAATLAVGPTAVVGNQIATEYSRSSNSGSRSEEAVVQRRTATQQFDKFTRLYNSYDEALGEDDAANTERLKKLLDDQTLAIYTTVSAVDPTLANMDMELDEFQTVLTQRAGDALLGSGQFKLQDDPTKMGLNIKKYGYGPAQMHRSLVSNVTKFEQSLAANTDLTESDKEQLRTNREAMSAQNFDSANELLSKGANAEEWLGTLQEGRANGKKDHIVLEEFISDPENYSELEARARGVGAAWGQGFVSMVTAPLAMAGNEWARESLIEASRENAARRERARLFGVEFGIGQDVFETIGPVFADMAVTAALTATTGAGGVMFLAAKQGAKLSAKNVTKGIVKSMTLNSPFKKLVVEGVEESSEKALNRLVKDGYILEPATDEIKKGAMGAIDQFGKIASNKWTQEAAINLPAFSRSAGASYAATYDTLTQMNPDMSHEEKHDRAFGSGIVAGFSTIAIMKGFRSIGRGGIEDAFIKGMTKREAVGVMQRLGGKGAAKLGSKDAEKVWGHVVGKIQKDMTKGVGKFAGQKNIVMEAFDGFTSEALEEGLDEFVNSYISDYYTDQNTDGMARLESVYRAALTGGIIGSGMGAYQKLGNRLSTREQSKIEQRRLEETFVTSVTSELENTGSRVSAEVVRGILTGKARGAKSAEQRAELTAALDPNFVPEDSAAAPETTAEGTTAPAPFTPTPLKGQVEELNKLKEERASLQAAGEEQTFLDSEQQERANEVDAKIAELETIVNSVVGQSGAAQPAATAAPVETDTAPVEPNPQTVANKYQHNPKMVKTIPSESVFENPEADSAGLSEEQQDQIDLAFEEELTPEQQALFEELDTFDITGTVRQLRILEAIQAGTLTKDGDEIIGMPEVVEPELAEPERRQVMADILAENDEGFIVGRLDQDTADAEAMRGTEADYTVDEQNYIIGVRNPETNEWSGKIPLQSVAVDTSTNMDEATSPESVAAALEEDRQEQAEKQALEGKAVIDTTTITETLSPEEAQAVTEELELDDERTIRGANLDTLAPVTPEQVDAAAEQGVDLVEVQEQMLLDIDKEGRVVESEEDQDIPMSAGQAEVAQATAEGPSFVNTPEDEVAFEALVASGFPSRVTSKTKSGFKVTRKPKGYYQTVSTEAARQIYATYPVTPLTKPEGGDVFEGRKQVHYNPHTKKMSSPKGAKVKGFLDASGRGVFDNDPVLTAEYIKAGKVVIVPEGITVNPAILIDPDTRRVLRVVSVNNNNEGLLQDGGDPDKVISTQANHNIVLSKGSAAGLFEQRFYDTPLEIVEAPQANGTTEAVEEGEVFTVGDFINNVTTFIQNGTSANAEGSVVGSLEKLMNPKGVAPLRGDYFDAGAQRFVAETILVANAYVARKNMLDSKAIKSLLTLKLGKDGKVAVGPKGKPTGEYVLKNNTAANRSKLIKAFISQTRLDGLPPAESTKQLAEMATSSGRSFSERAAKFVLKEVVNHPNLRENTMPPMKFIASLATDNFRKQQKDRVKLELQRDAESSQYTEGDVPAASAPDTSLESVSTEPLNRDELNDAIDQEDALVQRILLDPETPEVRNVLVELAVQFSNGNQQVADLVAGMSTNRIYSEVSILLQQNPNSSQLNTIMAKLEETNPTLHSMLSGGYGVARTGTPKQNKDHNTVSRNATKRLWSRSRVAEANRKVARAANLAEAERLGLVSGDADSVVAALQKISETGTPAHKLVANLLLENESLVRDVNFNIISANLPFAGMQATLTDGSLQVTLNLEGHNGRGLTNVLLEEYVHATLTKVLSKPRSSLTPAQLAAVTRLESLRTEVAEAATAAGYRNNSAIMDSLVNLDEFVAGIMLSPELQLEIKGLGADSGGKPFFRKIMDAVLDFFGKGVTAKEASTYADALADVIDLSRSTVKISDPRMKTRAKRVAAEATATIKATSDAFKATGLPAVSSSPEIEQDQADAELTADEILEQEANENLDDIVGQLTDRDTGSEGTVSPTERSADRTKAESLLQVARELIPPEVPLRIDRTINAAAEFKNGEVLINPAYLMELTQDLGIVSSKMIVAKVMSHELSHVASFNALTQEEIDELANTIPNYMFEDIIDNYYSDRPAEAAAARELLLASELDEQGQADLLDLKARLTEEHLRMRMETLTSGYTTEQDWAFYRTNPSMMKILFRYVSGYFRRMVEMRRFASELDNGSPNRFMDSAVNKLIHELRSIKAGYRLQESSIVFDPTRPDQGLAVLADKMEEGLTGNPEEFLSRTQSLQAAIALPADYVAKVSAEHNALRVGTAKIGTKVKPKETTQESNITNDMVSDTVLAKQMAKINYPQLPASVSNKRNPKTKQTAFVDWMVKNLVHLHNQFPQELRARATHWYDGARILADNLSDKYGYKAEQVAGVMAALSPQKDWFMNVAQADQLIDIFNNHQNTRLSRSRVGATMDSILEAAQAPAAKKKKAPKSGKESDSAKKKRLAFNAKLDEEARKERTEIFQAIEGKTLSELQSNETAHGWAIRILAQTIHGRDYKAISPEGEFGHTIFKKDGSAPAKNGWGSVSEIVKSVNILRGDSISDNLGEMHKVRNFYNNIIAPNSPYGDVTIDTHAVAAAHLLPFGASAIEVKHNFGSPMGGAPSEGVNGSYHLYADAYRQAAQQLGLQPRQLQSITWEAIRMVHPPESRRDKIYIAQQTKLWNNKNDEQARQELTADREFIPAWAGFGSDSRAPEIPAGLREDGDQDGSRVGVSVRDGGLQSAIGGIVPAEEGGNLPFSTWESLSNQGYNPDASEKTQITTTKATYLKIAQAEFKGGEKILDFAAGRGAGTQLLRESGYDIEGYEPFSNEDTRVITPEYQDVSKVPDAEYDVIVNNAVLNVVPQGTAVEILNDIYSKLKVGGRAYVNVMGWTSIKPRLKNPKTKLVGNREVLTQKGTFQKGYTNQTLRELIQSVLPEASVTPTKYGDIGFEITKAKPRTSGGQSRRRNPNVGLQSAIGREDQGVTEYDEQFMEEAEMSGRMYAFVEDMPYSVRKALERNDYLGYSSASEALANIASEQDWELGTELNTPSDQGIINRYINKLYGQTAEDVSWRRRNYGLQSAIAPSEGFDPDQMNYAGFIDQLELPFYATGGYAAPTSLMGRLLRGALDPRIERFIQNRQFFLNAAEKTAQSFKAKFDKQLKEAYPDGLDASDTANLNAALGGSAIVPEARRKEIEKEYQAELDAIAQTTYETVKARKLDEQIAKDNKFGKILAEKQVKAVAIREAQTAALAELDAVSPELAETIQGIRSQLIEPIQEKMKDLYDMSEDVQAHFDVQKGIYLTTQYRMFTETGFYEHAKSSPEFAGIREEAVKYFMEQRKVTRLEELRDAASANNVIFNDQEAQLVIEAEFGEQSETLQTLGQMDMDAFLAKYRRAGKNDVVSDRDAKIIEDNLKEKRDLDPRLKALLGEVGNEGTVDSIIRTFLTVSKMAANQSMYQNIKKMGQREGFLMTAQELKEARKLDPDTYVEWEALATDTTSDHNPLRGMYAGPEVRDGLQGLFKSEINTETDTDSEKVVGAVTSVLRKASGWSMATKTLGSVGFYIRNMLSNMVFFGPSQGFINVFAMGAKTKYVWDELKDPTRMDAYLSELSALGVIDNEIRSTMMEEMLNGTRNLSDVIDEQSKVIQGAAKATEATFGKAYAVATRMAGAVDGFYKIAYYENELKVLRKAKARADQEGGSFANYSDADLKQMARDKVLMTAQSASQAPPVVKEVAGHGIGALVAPFIRFKAEVPRVVFNTFKLAREEMGSDSSVIKARGYQRMAGMMSVGVGASGFGAAILAMLSGTDDEDMQDFQRETAPSYLRSHSFWGVPRWLSKKFGAGDKYQTVDLTYINPYALLADPIVRSYEKMMKGDLAGAGAALVNGLITDQYLDTQIAAGALSAVIENRDPTTNKPIVEDISDTSGEAAVKRLTFLFNEAYAPDVLKRAVKAYQTGTSEEKYTDPENTVNNILFGALRPFKVHTIDPERQLTNYLYQSRREFANVKARKNKVRSTKPMTEEGIIQLLIEEQEDRAAIINHNIRMARGAKKYGMTDRHVFQTLSQALTKRRAQNTMNGVMDRIVLTPDFTKSLIQNAKSEEEKQMKLLRVKNMFKQIGKMPLKQRLSEGPVRDR